MKKSKIKVGSKCILLRGEISCVVVYIKRGEILIVLEDPQFEYESEWVREEDLKIQVEDVK